MVIRQYYCYNLRQRFSSMPYLSRIEKLWISFQIIHSVSQIHNKHFCHGDIKPENILLTSAMTLFISYYLLIIYYLFIK